MSVLNVNYVVHGLLMFISFSLLNEVHYGFCFAKKEVYARFNENGIKGTVSIRQTSNDLIIVTATLYVVDGSNVKQCDWKIRNFPVDYTILEDRCSNNYLGTVILDLNKMFGLLPLNNKTEFSASINILPLTGIQGIWYNSMVIELPDGKVACSTLTLSDHVEYKAAKVNFYGSIYGQVYLFWIGIAGTTVDSVIISDLQHIHKGQVVRSEHKWGIYATDSLDTVQDKFKVQCNALQSSTSGLSELGNKLGKLKTGFRVLLRDPSLLPIDLTQKQHMYFLVINDDVHENSFLVCGQIILAPSTTLKTYLEADNVRLNVTLFQRSMFEPTLVTVEVNDNERYLGGFRIHELPPKPSSFLNRTKELCDGVRDVYNPTNKEIAAEAPIPGNATQDMYAIGDLSGKIVYHNKPDFDLFLPLSGKYSVMHRSIVSYRNKGDVEEPWLCGTLLPFTSINSNQKLPMRSAEVIFRYPIAGRIFFRQLSDNIYSDTVIIVESLVYSDGSSLLDTVHHNWTINEHPPDSDYYSWQNRCVSSGSVYNPYKIPNSLSNNFMMYSFADLSSTVGPLSIAGEKSKAFEISRALFTHPNLHLFHSHSIIGKSLVIYDENGPKARGSRLACGKITPVNRRKAVVRDWFSNGNAVSIMGKIEMYQYSEYDSVDIEADLQGLNNNKEFNIHTVPMDEGLQFPCENCEDIWNPFNVSDGNVYREGGTLDRYKAGDLSSKFGYLTNLEFLNAAYNDSTITLFGPLSVIGKSLVITEVPSNRRSACANIERGYSPKEARELRAIASFHHPLGFVYGYIKMTQLVHNDDSKSDVVMEVNLKYPGPHNRNMSRNHLWMIYVNRVSVDATVASQQSRCTAGGYVWNPFFTQLAAPVNEQLYFKECGPDNPLRCYHGDISGRLSTISVGAEKKVFSDPYLTLEGDGSVLGRSVVILDKNFGNDRFACANIEPDKDIIKYANIQKSPNFVPSQFLSDVREVLGVPEWMMTIDNRKTKILHNGMCVQLLFHFKGPDATKIEFDFSDLLRTGRLSAPSISVPGYVPPDSKKKSISYTTCPTKEASIGNGQAGHYYYYYTPHITLYFISLILLQNYHLLIY